MDTNSLFFLHDDRHRRRCDVGAIARDDEVHLVHIEQLGVDAGNIGLSLALTGALASGGKVMMIALKLWEDDVNARGGLLGRPVQLIYS